MNTIIKGFIAVSLFLLVTAPVFAVGSSSGSFGPGFDPTVDDGCAVPLDGGLSLLAVAGLGFGLKKYYDSRKKQNNPA